jgi:endonuclease III
MTKSSKTATINKKGAVKAKVKRGSSAGANKSGHSGKPSHSGAIERPTALVPIARAGKMMSELCSLYPEAACELKFATPFQLLIATILSAQTTDVSVNKVTGKLFARYPDAKALAEADLDQVKEMIKQTGYFNAKATNIQNCARQLIEQFRGEVPKTQAELVTLPGVGIKTANVVLGEAYGIPGWTVDTHVQRLSNRLGFTTNHEPIKIEHDLQKLFPKEDWSKLSITLIWHGRRMCFARKPACQQCPINQLCPSAFTQTKKPPKTKKLS